MIIVFGVPQIHCNHPEIITKGFQLISPGIPKLQSDFNISEKQGQWFIVIVHCLLSNLLTNSYPI